VGGDTLAALLTKVDPDGTLVMFGNSSGQTTTFNARDRYLDTGRATAGLRVVSPARSVRP
jgi:NADPH:quinone reductase-like Zn-dependent oxidoreductase